MRRVELARGRPLLAPRIDELSILRELHDARIRIPAVSVGDENVTVRSGCDSRRPVEGVRTGSCYSCLTKHQQDLSIRIELDDLVALAVFSLSVSHPHVAVFVDMHAVREHEHSRPKRFHRLAGPIELEYRRKVRTGAGI